MTNFVGASALSVLIAAVVAVCSPTTATAEGGDDILAEAGDAADLTEGSRRSGDPAQDFDEDDQHRSGDWRTVMMADDAERIANLDSAWREGLAEARASEDGAEVAALGALVDPDAALTGRLQPPPGQYRCRSIRFGTQSGIGLSYIAYPFFRCSVELTAGGDLVLTKITGSQRTRGLLYPDGDLNRLVYIGAQSWGDSEPGYFEYGELPERNHVGVLERIGAQRWRLVIPWPRQESKLEIIELVR